MNITASDIVKTFSTQRRKYLDIDEYNTDAEFSKQRKMIAQKINEWTYSDQPDSKIQHFVSDKMKDEESISELFDFFIQQNNQHTFIAKLKNSQFDKNIFFVKTIRFDKLSSVYKHSDFVIEAYINVLLNKLASKIRNFVIIHATFKCGLPTKIEDNLYQWCSQKSCNGYIMLENIEHAVALNQFVLKTETKNLMNVFIQIACALRLAKTTLNFSHNDLSSKNIMIQRFEKEQIIRIYTPHGLRAIKSHYLAKIIDFEYSSIEIKTNNMIGINHAIENNGLRDCQIHEEFFYLLIDTYFELAQKNNFYNPITGQKEKKMLAMESKSEKNEAMEKEYENYQDLFKLFERIHCLFSYECLNNLCLFANNMSGMFRHVLYVENEIETFDKIINSMIDMKYVKLYKIKHE